MNKDLKHWFIDARVFLVIFGIVVMGFGLYTHYESIWSDSIYDPRDPFGDSKIKPDQLCKLEKELVGDHGKPCPSLAMEQYYISIIIICCILSCVGMIASWLINFNSQPLKNIDFGLHLLSALLMLSAGIIYIVSTELINNLYGREDMYGVLKRKEKLIAGGLTILQASLYVYVGVRIRRQMD